MSYASCNQIAKDQVNRVLVNEVCSSDTSAEECIVTLDDVDNGTCSAFAVDERYKGQYVVIQLDALTADVQDANWRSTFPERIDQFTVHAKQNICDDLPQLGKLWQRSRDVRLFNFDYFSTFYTYPTRTLDMLTNLPDMFSGDERGTLIAFTFQAIPHGGLFAKLRSMWPVRCEEYDAMRSWSDISISKFYTQKFNTFIESKLTCTAIEPVELSGSGLAGRITVYENTIIYRGNSQNDSVMMFSLFRARHDPKCNIKHTYTNKCERDAALDVEDDAIEEESEKMREISKGKRKRVHSGGEPSAKPKRNCNIDAMDTRIVENDEHFSGDESDYVESEYSDDVGGDEDGTHLDSDMSDSDTQFVSDDESIPQLDMSSIPSESNHWSDLSQMALFPHQIQIIEAVKNAPNRGYISAICGSGKSLPMILSCKAVSTSVIFVPYKILVEQFYHQYLEHDVNCDVYRVNSDNLTEIRRPIENRTTIYLANFDSAHRVAALGLNFDLVNWDEAHLATSDRRRDICKNDCESIDAASVKIDTKKTVFWTATPNRKMLDHPEIYGHELFHYSYNQAVAERIIKPFGIFISCYKDDELNESLQTQYEKIVELSSKFIQNEGCRRVLIYVNWVKDQNGKENISVDRIRKNRKMFPESFTMDFFDSKTPQPVRKNIFQRFNETSENVHVIISCRTVSVGVDLPSCDAVIFASSSGNVTEIIQRGLRPCRLTAEERIQTGNITSAKIFFPINASSAEIRNLIERNKRDENIHRQIRGNALETPMAVLNLLKEGLEIEFDFINGNSKNRTKGSSTGKSSGGETGNTRIEMQFPYSNYMWGENSDFDTNLNHLCVSMKKNPRAIDGWDEMSLTSKAEYVASWSKKNGGRSPKNVRTSVDIRRSSRIEEESLLGRWIYTQYRKGYIHCSQNDFESLKKFDWWLRQNKLKSHTTTFKPNRHEILKKIAEFAVSNKAIPKQKKGHPLENMLWKRLNTWKIAERRGELSKDDRDLIEKTLSPFGFSFIKIGHLDTKFKNDVQSQREFLLKNERYPKSNALCPVELKLSRQIGTWRKAKKKDELTPIRQRHIERELDGWSWNHIDGSFIKQIAEQVDFAVDNHHIANQGVKSSRRERALANVNCKWRKLFSEGKMCPEHKELIDEKLAPYGWSWLSSTEILENGFRSDLHKAKIYVITHGKLPTESTRDPDSNYLARRFTYWRKLLKSNRLSPTWKSDIENLLNPFGWMWDKTHDGIFRANVDKMFKFFDEKGRYPSESKDSDENEVSLAKLLQTWRNDSNGTMTKSRYAYINNTLRENWK